MPLAKAVCDLGAQESDYTYIEDSSALTVPDGAQGSAKVKCPAGQPAVGGGAFVFGLFADEQYLTSNAPFDGKDRNRAPEDGWRVTVTNDGDPGMGTATATPVVICDGQRSASAYRYVRKRKSIPDGKQTGRYVACSEGKSVVGGGVEIHAAPQLALLIHSTFPNAVGSTRGWTGVVNNSGTPGEEGHMITVHAICRR